MYSEINFSHTLKLYLVIRSKFQDSEARKNEVISYLKRSQKEIKKMHMINFRCHHIVKQKKKCGNAITKTL